MIDVSTWQLLTNTWDKDGKRGTMTYRVPDGETVAIGLPVLMFGGTQAIVTHRTRTTVTVTFGGNPIQESVRALRR